jgi:hypothetical protein
MSSPTLSALVYAIRWEASEVVSVELRPATGEVEFPPFEAGSHINLHLPNGLSRSYSLCNSDAERGRYVVGVRATAPAAAARCTCTSSLRVGSPCRSIRRATTSRWTTRPRAASWWPAASASRPCCAWQRLVAQGRPFEMHLLRAQPQGRGLRRRHRGAGARTPCR